MISVTGLSIAPIKGTRVRAVEEIRLERFGVRENRRFYVIDHRDHLVNGKRLGELTALVSDYDHDRRRLRLEFPDGTVLEETIGQGPLVRTWFFSQESLARLVEGPWSDALTQYTGSSAAAGRGAVGGGRPRDAGRGVADLPRLAGAGWRRRPTRGEIDCRRFRMLIEVDGIDRPRRGRLGRPDHQRRRRHDPLARTRGPLPDHQPRPRQRRDRPADAGHARQLPGRASRRTEPLPFGIYGEVLRGRDGRVGDPVSLVRHASAA